MPAPKLPTHPAQYFLAHTLELHEKLITPETATPATELVMLTALRGFLLELQERRREQDGIGPKLVRPADRRKAGAA